MKRINASTRWPRIACVAVLVCLSAAAQAQTSKRTVAPKALPAAPAAASQIGMPNPAGLTSQFPAGLPSTSPFPAGMSAGTQPASPAETTQATVLDSSGNALSVQLPNTAISGGPGTPAGRIARYGAGGGSYTAQEIAASFLGADANHDGELTRAEALRLTIMPYGFDDMDANHDGILSRSEYEAGFAR